MSFKHSRRGYSWWHKLVAILLVFVMLSAFTAPVMADDDPPPGDPQGAVAACVIGVVVIVVGIIVIYKLIKLCNRLLPPTPAPAPPPPAVTNAPPGGPFTNGVPGISNRPPITVYPAYNGAPISMAMEAIPELKLNDDDVKVYAIEASNYRAPDGSLYHTYIPMEMATSTDLKNWEPLSVKMYVSDSAVLTQTGTNGAMIQFKNQFTQNWTLDLGLPAGTSARFVRSASWPTNSP